MNRIEWNAANEMNLFEYEHPLWFNFAPRCRSSLSLDNPDYSEQGPVAQLDRATAF